MSKLICSRVLLLLLTVYFLGAIACKTDPKTESETTVTTSTNTTVTTRLRAEPDNLNIMLTYRGWALHVARFIYPTMLEYNPNTLELSPQLVKAKPEISPITEGPYAGGTKFTYEILDEAVWDNGTPITANDYIFSLKMLFNPHVASEVYRPIFSFIKNVEVDPNNPKRFTVIGEGSYIKAEHASGYFLFPEYVFDPEGVMQNFSITDMLNPEKAKELGNSDERLKQVADVFNGASRDPKMLTGPGAYVLKEWTAGEQIILEKKENWWGDKLENPHPMLVARPKRLIFKFIPDATAAITMVKDQQLDVIDAIPMSQFKELEENELIKQNYSFHTPSLLGYSYIAINTRRPKLADKRVRQALAHLLDTEEIIRSVCFGYAQPIIGPFHPRRDYYHKDLKPIRLDVEKAKSLLAEAGWEDSNQNGTLDKVIDGERVELEIEFMITPTSAVSNDILLIFQKEAKKAGVNIKSVVKEANTLRADRKAREFDMFLAGTSEDLGLNDPRQHWHTASDTPAGANYSGFGSAETDAIIDEIRVTLDPAVRTPLYLKLQETIYDEQPFLFLYATKDRILINKRFKGVSTSVQSPRYFENQWYTE